MSFYFISGFVITLFLVELLYFKIADKYNIIDRPNHRSSHTQITIRGGGIIFSVAIILVAALNFKYPYFIIGLMLITFISFIDDVKPLSNTLRIATHLAAVTLLFYQLNILILPFYWILFAFIFVIGTINAVNFMDGINGITGGYGLVALSTLWYINRSTAFTDDIYLIAAIISVLVFCFFNFRKRARCFAGDVGSISLSFIILFFLLQLIIKTQNVSYILILLIYGLDTVTTILFRLIRRENIFEAHRSHFYQFLANEKQMSHMLVALLYMIAQELINIFLLNNGTFKILNLILCIFAITLAVVFFRLILEGREKLLKRSTD
nr:glycosyltransferase family 4 protein [uncultured Mucilaginibacter sp.]